MFVAKLIPYFFHIFGWQIWKKWTLEKFFPRLGVLVLKHSSFITDFAYHGFSFPPKKRDEQGPPVLTELFVFV